VTHDSGETYDVVLSDIEMPRMDGLHLTSNIKGDARFRNIPVVLFSSLISESNMNKGVAVGADAQITKFLGNELIEAIEGLLTR
jgi:two-component system chemotaxis response regulator CheV